MAVESKHHTHMVRAFTTLFEQTQRRPKNLRTDKGTEFTNRAVKKLLKDQGINAYTTKNETKANYAERVILIEAFQDATKEAHGYLLIDLKPSTEDKLRVRTGLLPSDKIVVNCCDGIPC